MIKIRKIVVIYMRYKTVVIPTTYAIALDSRVKLLCFLEAKEAGEPEGAKCVILIQLLSA